MSRDLTDALSKLFLKLGGKTSDSKENKGPVDYIDDITDIVEPSGEDGAVIVKGSFEKLKSDTGTSVNVEIDNYDTTKLHNDITNNKQVVLWLNGLDDFDNPISLILPMSEVFDFMEDGSYYSGTFVRFGAVANYMVFDATIEYNKNNLDYPISSVIMSDTIKVGRE